MPRLSIGEAKPTRRRLARTAAVLMAGILATGCTDSKGAPSDTPPTVVDTSPTSNPNLVPVETNTPNTASSATTATIPNSTEGAPTPTTLPGAGSASNPGSDNPGVTFNPGMKLTFSDLDARVEYGVGVYSDITSPADQTEAVTFYPDGSSVDITCKTTGREVDSVEGNGDAPRDASDVWLKILGLDQYATVIYTTVANPATDPQIQALPPC